MRVLTLTACLAVLAVADGSALAASGCGKGLLWPFVRQPGDCLTDVEIRQGQRGVYNGPVDTNPDMSGVRIETPAQSTGVTQSTTPVPAAPAAAGTPQPTATASAAAPAAPAPAVPATGGATLFTGQANTPGPTLNGPGFVLPPSPRMVGEAPCKKGWLWPFVRDPGDCLTEAEKGNGDTGVYRAEQVVATAAPAAGPGGVTQVSAPGQSASAPAPNATPACRKGWLWPFVRKAGDCPTDAERGRR